MWAHMPANSPSRFTSFSTSLRLTKSTSSSSARKFPPSSFLPLLPPALAFTAWHVPALFLSDKTEKALWCHRELGTCDDLLFDQNNCAVGIVSESHFIAVWRIAEEYRKLMERINIPACRGMLECGSTNIVSRNKINEVIGVGLDVLGYMY